MGGRGLRPMLVAAVVALVLPSAADASRNLYVTSSSVDPRGIAAYEFLADGALAPLQGQLFSAGTSPSAITLSPDGTHLYVTDANQPTASVHGFNVAAGGFLEATVPGSPFTDTLSPQGITITPDGRFMYVAKFSDDAKFSGYSIAADGALTPIPGSPFDAGAGQIRQAGIITSPDSRRLYIAINQKSGGSQETKIAGFTLRNSDGVPSAISGSPFDGVANNPADLVMTPDGTRLYSVNIGGTSAISGGTVSGFTVAAATGALTQVSGSPISAGGAIALGGAISPDGSRLFVTSRGGVAVFDLAANGTMTPVPGTPVSFGAATEPAAVALTPDGKRLYVTDQAKKEIRGFDVNADGTLASVPNSPFIAPVGAPTFETLAISPNQPPVAAFATAPAPPGQPTLVDATGSTDSDGTVARYDWDLGDGTTLGDAGPTVMHTYKKAGTYNVTLTVTDNEGCSVSLVFTGQITLCNGSSVARLRQQVVIPDIVDPKLRIKGSKVQRLGPAVAVKATCSEPCRAVATGELIVTEDGAPGERENAKQKRYRLFRGKGKLFPGNFNTLRLKLPPRVRKAAKRSVEAGGRVKARIVVKANDPTGNRAKPKRRVVRLVG